jgi:hypothetical protein
MLDVSLNSCCSSESSTVISLSGPMVYMSVYSGDEGVDSRSCPSLDLYYLLATRSIDACETIRGTRKQGRNEGWTHLLPN